MKLLDDMFQVVSVTRAEEELSFRLRTLPECPIYQAHFPAYPITPGVCLVQVVGELLSMELHQQLALSVVKNVKFLSVLVPGATTEVVYHIHYDAASMKASVTIQDDTTLYAKMVLLFCINDANVKRIEAF